MGDYSRLRLLGSVLPVIRSGLPQTVATRLRVGSQESLDHVLGHLNNMIQLSAQRLSAGVQQQDDVLGLILGVCCFIYKYLAEQSGSDAVAKKLSERLSNADVVWTDGGFVPPSRVAFRCNYDCRPYLFQLEAGLQQFRPLFQAIGVQETFNSNRGVWVLQQINTQYCGRPLSTDMIGLVNRAAQMLCEAVKSEGGSLSGNKVFLPDCHAVMRRADQLCFGDSPWLNELENVKFVHDSISVDTARVLGVKTRKRKVYDELVKAIPFGQKEKLTDRIKGLLKGYTIDSSLFKELLQNADDAGATEIRFIKNFRHFGVNRIPEGWEKLQGPALCVYNNRSFTSQDMEGIHNLGRGSKGSDLLKTGQYGVGFNAVYHITDTPSFWTLQDDVDEVICVFDPSCMYLPDLSPYEPGVKFEDVSGLREAYPDLFAAYIRSGVTMNEPGTLFRFPLRTEEMAKTSDIKNEAVTVDDIAQLLENFKEEMGACLLFLNNINSIGIYSATDLGRTAAGVRCAEDLR
ncbi:hypothetical protein BaRGS_00013383 [Batillaria attramentaria]|uniref:Sacsin/Nov domain-containing protein n=1 Tax=Batillaria attramentaria TaxID=370345 RepID=A0ABD0L8L4_9CAEN